MSKEIELTQGKFAIVDDEDFEWLSQWKWTYKSPQKQGWTGYAYRQYRSHEKIVDLRMHRAIMNPPTGTIIDHINHDGLDNRKQNLRMADPSESLYNTRPRRGGTSPYKGVSFEKRYRLWAAEIHVKKQKIRLGYFESEIEAALAYNEAAAELHGEFAFPNDVSSHVESPMISKPRRVQSSVARGVQFSKQKQKWIACIYLNKKRRYLGTFSTEAEAIAARIAAEIKYGITH